MKKLIITVIAAAVSAGSIIAAPACMAHNWSGYRNHRYCTEECVNDCTQSRVGNRYCAGTGTGGHHGRYNCQRSEYCPYR